MYLKIFIFIFDKSWKKYYSYSLFAMSSETEETPQFRQQDLPVLDILPDFESSDSSDSDESSSLAPSTPNTPITPATPLSQLATEVTSFGFGDIEEGGSTFATPKPKRVYRKKKKGFFTKGHPGYKRRILPTDTPSKRIHVSRPRSELFSNLAFPREPFSSDVLIKQDGVATTRSMYVPHGMEMINMDILCKVLSLLRCKDPCCSGSMQLHKHPRTDGLQSYFILHCNRCHSLVAQFSSSLHIGESPAEAVNNQLMTKRCAAEINSRALVAMHSTAMSWRDFLLLCALMDLPVPGRNLNKRTLENLKSCTSQVVEKSMSAAAERVRKRDTTLLSNIPGAYRCDVSFDATWHRRGHYSNQGFGAVIDAVSNKVLDYTLYQRICRKCSQWPIERQNADPEAYSTFLTEHKPVCSANFSGTSQAMESSAAVEIWKRSVDKNRLVYSTYIGDGDSSSFKNLLSADPYQGKEPIRKEECLGHVQKRLKNHLKEKSNAFAKLPLAKVERVSQLFALVVVQNRGRSPTEIQTALLNLLEHLIDNHDKCPYSTESWCYLQKRLAEYAEDSSIGLPPLRKPYLTHGEYRRAKEVFDAFASLTMCGALTMGKTQNANESLHSVIWHNSPKGKYVGQLSMEASTSMAVSTFNDGDMALAAVLCAMSIPSSHSTLLHLTRRDQARNRNREYAILETQKRRRRKLHAQAIMTESSRKRREKPGQVAAYKSGMFGTEMMEPEVSGDESDTTCNVCNLRFCPIGRKKKSDDWIACELCESWFHCTCVKVDSKSLGEDPYFCDACS